MPSAVLAGGMPGISGAYDAKGTSFSIVENLKTKEERKAKNSGY